MIVLLDHQPQSDFYVVIHDVAPRFAAEIQLILTALSPLVGTHLAAAVVPAWHGDDARTKPEFWSLVENSFDEVLLHGYRHCNDKRSTWLSCLTDRADEFSRLNDAECEQRVAAGASWASEMFGERRIGFLPPAWQRGRLTSELLARHGLRIIVGQHAMTSRDGQQVPLATWSWDCGRIGWLGPVAEWYGSARKWWWPHALPVVAIHPADVQRGYLPRSVAICRQLLAEGRRPVIAQQLMEAKP